MHHQKAALIEFYLQNHRLFRINLLFQ